MLGHEVSGVVEQIGCDVTRLQVGDHVVARASLFCGGCDQCVSGHIQHCQSRSRRGVRDRARLMHNAESLTQSPEQNSAWFRNAAADQPRLTAERRNRGRLALAI